MGDVTLMLKQNADFIEVNLNQEAENGNLAKCVLVQMISHTARLGLPNPRHNPITAFPNLSYYWSFL
jgi:hypothetical protein